MRLTFTDPNDTADAEPSVSRTTSEPSASRTITDTSSEESNSLSVSRQIRMRDNKGNTIGSDTIGSVSHYSTSDTTEGHHESVVPRVQWARTESVSYTHLTLPTICSV